MERLIKDAAALDSSIDANSMSFANIVKAINVVQTEMGITGTTALEAGRTISGSVGAMKSAWANLLTGLADGNADVGELVNNLVTTIVGDGTESNLGVLGNVMPAVKTALSGASKLVSELLPKIVQEIPSIINENLPILAEAAISIIQSLVDGISENQEMLMTTAFDTIVFLVNSFISMLPQIVQLGLDLIVSLANGIATSLPTLIPTIMSVIMQIVDTLTNPENLSNLLQAALSIITQLAWGLVNALPNLIDAVMVLIENIVTFLLDPQNLAMLVMAAIELVIALGMGIIEAIPKLMTSIAKLVVNIVDYFVKYDWGKLGKNLVDGFKKGIQNAWTNLKTWFQNLFGDLVGIAKKILGIASPSKVFKKIGGFAAEGFGIGFDDEFAKVQKDVENFLNFDDISVRIKPSTGGNVQMGGLFGYGNVSVVQNIYSEAKTAADLMQEALYQQKRAVLLGV